MSTNPPLPLLRRYAVMQTLILLVALGTSSAVRADEVEDARTRCVAAWSDACLATFKSLQMTVMQLRSAMLSAEGSGRNADKLPE